MNSNLTIFLKSTGFLMPALVFIILFLIVYGKKKTKESKDKALYTFLLNTIIIPIILEITALGLVIFLPDTLTIKNTIVTVAYRIFFVSTFFWFFTFAYYQVLYVFKHLLANSESERAKKITNYATKVLGENGKKERIITYLVAFFYAILFGTLGKFSIIYLKDAIATHGRLPMILGVSFFLFSMIFYSIVIFYRKKIKNLNITPFFVIIITYCITTMLASVLGWYTNNIVAFFGFLMTIIYFTTESQDVEILDRYTITKENERKSIAAKQKILINMSHEVRSPMHNILGYGNMITSGEETNPEEVKLNIESIKNSVYDLKDMVDNIYDISKIESEQITVNQVQYECKNLYTRINEFALRKSSNEELHFTFEFDQMLPGVQYGDQEKIYKIVTKLLENAINKTSYGEVKLNIVGKMLDTEFIELTYTISNSGHVMTNEMFDMTYEDFMLSEENVDYIKLGVVIAKKYIELIGGEVEFINQPGQGTKYIIKFRQKVISSTPVGSLTLN